MNKEEFSEKLDSKIDVLEKSEREKIIKKYKTTITKRINKGEKEEDVISSYDLDKLTKGILDEHGIKEEKTESNRKSKGFFGDLIATIEGVVNSLSKKSFKEVLMFLIELVIIILVVAILKIPFEFIKSILISLFSAFGGVVSTTLNYTTNLVVEIIYFIFAVIVFIAIFKKRFEKYKK